MKRSTHFNVHPGWKLLIRDMDLSPVHVLTHAGLPADLFSRKDARLTPQQYFDLLHGLEKVAGTQELPLKVGQAISVEAFDPPIFACLCSPDLNTAMQRLSDYKRLICPMVMDLDIGLDQTSISIECYGYSNELPRAVSALELVFLTRVARLATRTRIVPVVLELPELPDDPKPYEDWFGGSLRRSDHTRIAFSAEDARRPFLTDNPAMWDFFDASLKKKLSDLDAETTVSQRVKSTLLELLPGGRGSIEDVAGQLAMSKRSLQRHLGRESSGYQEILNNTRAELARHYLLRSDISPGEISFLLGFRDSNSFLRAFKGWTGATPGEFRSIHQ